MSISEIFHDVLPYPVYEFVGGPCHGERRAVPLYEDWQGRSVPPRVFHVRELPPIRPRPVFETMPVDERVVVHTYIFRPTKRCNVGFYAYDAAQGTPA